MEEQGTVHLLGGGQTLQVTDVGSKLYEGLPPAMAFAAPSGFLGRQAARDAVKSLPTPESLRDWSDDHRAAYLFTMGMNLPGNLVFGDAALALDMRFRSAEPIARSEKRQAYVEFADRLKDSGAGSSAGGEQPKFLCLTEDHGHLIVKFARVGTRMAELLPLEHLALQSLDEASVRAACTHLELAGDYVFLEVERFDRVGRHGRVGALTAGAIDDEEFRHRDSWSEFADRCERARMLSAPQAMAIHVMAAFSELIGNGDRHFENISLLVDDQGQPVDVAPAYDILPMRYAPIGGGVDPDLRPIEPSFGSIGGRETVWRVAHAAAARFWDRVQHDRELPLVSAAMRELAGENLRVATAFAAPLLGA